MGRDSATSLAPGFRFHPTDEELVRYYLRRKVSGKKFRFDAISEVDVYKSEPWDLPSKSKLKTRDLEWYFFSVLDKKYGNGGRTNRATEKGYWKTTGKDRPVHHNSLIVGMKKTLVYHSGRAPRGQRTNWVMHEYRLIDEELEKAGISQDAFVLCRIFQKSGPGPKNGERYGAPLNEEEWEDEDEVAYFPGKEAQLDDEVEFGDDVTFDVDDCDKSLDAGRPTEDPSLEPNYCYGETINYVEHPRAIIKDDQNPVIGTVETDGDLVLDLPCNNESEDSPGHPLASISIKDEYVDEPNITNTVGFNFLLDEPYFDATDYPSLTDRLLLEANDLSNSTKVDTSNSDILDEYLAFLDMDNDNLQSTGFDSTSPIMRTEDSYSDKSSRSHKLDNEGTEQACTPNELLNSGESSSKELPEAPKIKSDMDYPFIKQTSHMLGNMPAPLAFTADFPSKDAVLRLNSSSSSSSSGHVTAGIIRISNVAESGHETDWPSAKNRDVNIFLSVPLSDLLPCKTRTSVLWGLSYFIYNWVLILPISFKVGMSLYAR